MRLRGDIFNRFSYMLCKYWKYQNQRGAPHAMDKREITIGNATYRVNRQFANHRTVQDAVRESIAEYARRGALQNYVPMMQDDKKIHPFDSHDTRNML